MILHIYASYYSIPAVPQVFWRIVIWAYRSLFIAILGRPSAAPDSSKKGGYIFAVWQHSRQIVMEHCSRAESACTSTTKRLRLTWLLPIYIVSKKIQW